MSSIDALMERTQWDLSFVPPDTRIVDRPELLYCVSLRDVPHLNCVVRTRLNDETRAAAIEEVSEAHASVISQWLVHDWREDDLLSRALSRTGYRPAVEHRAFVSDASREIEAAEHSVVRRVETLEAFRDGAAVFHRAFEVPRTVAEAEEVRRLNDCKDPTGRVHRFVAYEDGKPVSGGAMTLFPSLGLAMLWRGGTVPEARGRGHYRAVLRARMRTAAQRGIGLVGLYANLGTSAPIVEALGFEGYGRMTYWNRDGNGG